MESAAQTDERGRRAVARYLDLLRDALLDWHYLENELRIEHLLESLASGEPVDPDRLANPTRHMTAELRRLKQEREAGEFPADAASAARSLFDAGTGRDVATLFALQHGIVGEPDLR